MNIDKNKFLAALMAVGLGGAAAACGGDAEATEDPVPADTTAGAEDVVDDTGDAMGDMGDMGDVGDEGMDEGMDEGVAPTDE